MERFQTMRADFAVVVTTINPPTVSLIKIAELAELAEAQCIIIGDEKSEKTWELKNCTHFGINQQLNDIKFKELAKLIPLNHYSRKNLGYLLGFDTKVQWIYETDDDNYITSPQFIVPEILSNTNEIHLEQQDWVNIFDLYTNIDPTSIEGRKIWPRGFPLPKILESIGRSHIASLGATKKTPITSSLVNGDPDVDAIYRLTCPLPFNFVQSSETYVLGEKTYCPFNSQNTWWHRSVLPLMYLPVTTSFRVTDILRSYVAQTVLPRENSGIRFTGPNAVQERNFHSLIKDFEQEIPLYLRSTEIVELLENERLSSLSITDSLMHAYTVLLENHYVQEFELEVLQSWLKCCDSLMQQPT